MKPNLTKSNTVVQGILPQVATVSGAPNKEERNTNQGIIQAGLGLAPFQDLGLLPLQLVGLCLLLNLLGALRIHPTWRPITLDKTKS